MDALRSGCVNEVYYTTNLHNVVRATFDGLNAMESAEQYAKRTGQDLETVYANYTVHLTAAVS